MPPPITKSQLIIDSGCSHGTLHSWQEGMTNREQVDWLIHFGNGSVAKIPERGCIGNLTGISICPDIAVQVVSVSQLAAQLDCPVIFTGEKAYILKPGSTVQFKETSIMLTADQVNGLYPISTRKFIKRIVVNSALEENSDLSEEDMK